MNEALQRYPGTAFNFSQNIQDNVEEAMSGVKGENSLKLFGEDIDVLAKTAARIQTVMGTVPGVTDLAVFTETGQPNLVISIDRTMAGRYGLMATDVNAAVEAAIGGTAATQILEGDRRFDVQSADIGNQECVVPIVNCHLAVGHVAVVDVAEAATEADDLLWQFLLAEPPAGLVQLVRILVPNVAVAGGVDPVPVVMQALAFGDDVRRRAGPEVEIETGRNGGFGLHQADGSPAAVTDGVCGGD